MEENSKTEASKLRSISYDIKVFTIIGAILYFLVILISMFITADYYDGPNWALAVAGFVKAAVAIMLAVFLDAVAGCIAKITENTTPENK